MSCQIIRRAKWTPEQDEVIRQIYPLLGSKGVLEIMPWYNRVQINQRAFNLGVKRNVPWQKQLADEKRAKSTPTLRPPSSHHIENIYPESTARLAYALPWRRR